MSSIDELVKRLNDLNANPFCHWSQWKDLTEDAIAECRRLRKLLDRPVATMDDTEAPYCPGDDEAPTGDPHDDVTTKREKNNDETTNNADNNGGDYGGKR